MSTDFMAAKTTKDGRALLKPVVVRQKAQQPDTDASDLVANLIEAAKKMQIRKLRRTIVDIKQSSKNLSGGRAAGAMSPALGLGNVSALESRPLKSPLVQPSINGTDDNGRTALHFSCGMASTECAVVLLESGAEVNVRDNEGFTPLHMAAGYGRSQSVELLLKAGANPFVKDKIGRTPRELAVEIRDTGMRHDGSSVPRGDMEATITLLGSAEWKEHQAAKGRQHNAIGGNAVESGGGSAADDGAKRPAAGTPLDELLAAAQAGEADGVAKALAKLEARSDVTWIAGRAASLANAFSVAVAASESTQRPHVSRVSLPPFHRHTTGTKRLSQRSYATELVSAYNGHEEALSALVRHGAGVDARSHGGVTPLIAAAEGRHACCIHLLVQAGADVNARTSEGKTALMHAVGRNSVPATEALLAGGADVSAVDGEGLSALHHGARLDASDCVELLCAKGASMTKRCKKGRTALMDAPKGSASAAILEEKWKALEEEVARRQLELLELFADDASDAASASSKTNAPAAADAKSGKDKKKAGKGRSRTPKGTASLTSKLQGLAEGPGSAAGSAAGSVGSAGLVGDVQNLVVKTPESSSRPSMSPASSVLDFGQTTDSSGMSTAEDEEGEGEGEDGGSEYDSQDIFEIMAAASKKGSGGGGGRVGGGVGSGAGVAEGNDGFIPVGSGEKAPNRVSEAASAPSPTIPLVQIPPPGPGSKPVSSTGSPTPSAVRSGSNGCTCKQSQQHCEENTGELARRVAELETELRAARAAADAARAVAAAERARAAQLEQQLISGRKAAEIISARDKSQIQVLQVGRWSFSCLPRPAFSVLTPLSRS
ncbi:unnamed protein product [Closterium sp. Yama58-4]|nr:unnamed protein product [Closterium sp. Yama58-4]